VDYIGKENLELLEEMAPFYNRFLAKKFKNLLIEYQPKSDNRILDFGAGIGSLALELRAIGLSNIDCLEIDEKMHTIITDRGFSAYSSIQELPKSYSFVYMSNVLEHIENDQQVLEQIQDKILDHNGTLVIYVPAFELLYSKLDVQVGHFRRYKKSTLVSVVERAGLTVRECEYVDSLGFVALGILKLFLGKRLNLSRNKKLVGVYDRYFFPLSRVLDHLGSRFIVGKNVLLVATKAQKT
jgi:SAM-dependent methyltransferase